MLTINDLHCLLSALFGLLGLVVHLSEQTTLRLVYFELLPQILFGQLICLLLSQLLQ